MTHVIVHIFFYIIFGYLSLIVAYLLVLAVAGNFSRARKKNNNGKDFRIAILIPSHREDEVIVQTVTSANGHDYPKNLFDVYVAADHLQKSTIDKLKATGATVYELNFERGSKARSLHFLLNNIDETRYDLAVILDGDNIMQPGFLHRINQEVREGKQVIQAHRSAKNLNTSIAILDALSEEVNNHLFRNGPAQLGLSSSLIGSGMAFPFGVLKSVYNKPGIIDNPACDREVDFEMLVNRLKVHYVKDAVVLDEKVASEPVYKNQRRRWLESQWMHIRLFFSDWSRVKDKNPDFWHKLFITLLPPRLLMLALFLVLLIVAVIQSVWELDITGIPIRCWFIIFGLYLLSILLSIPRRFYSGNTFAALLHLPSMLLTFLRALLTARSKRTEFVHTPKSYTNGSASTTSRK